MNKKMYLILGAVFMVVTLMFGVGCKKPTAQKQTTEKKATPAPEKKAEKKDQPKADEIALKFTGGPQGGTFRYFGSGISKYVSDHVPGLRISNETSEGSTENLRKLDSGEAHFGIVYSGDCYLGRVGKLSGDTKKYTNARALAFLYNAPAQLAVLKKSGINKVADLAGKRVDIGGPGSGAAASAERFFKTLKLWDKIKISTLGYTKAAQAMKDGQCDAMWVLAGYPTAAVIDLSNSREIKLLDVWDEGKAAGLDKEHPYYTPLTIPAAEVKDKYKGIDKDTKSFFDSALWVASKDVPEDAVYKALKAIYTKEGLAYLVTVKKTAKQMTVKGGVTGIAIPLHKGAEKFWKEKGLTIPDTIKAE